MAPLLLLVFAVITDPPAAIAPIAVTPDGVLWKPAPPSLPTGARVAVLEGDPTKEGIVTMRLKLPKDYRLAMHTHTAAERVTVLSGAMRVTWLDPLGGAVAPSVTRSFPAGSFYVTPKGTPHAVATDDETIIQITVQGLWGIVYADARDDPRSAPARTR
jgi:quercetin dioxygenase-like cupin family protein